MNNSDLLRENLELTEQVNQLACELEDVKGKLAELEDEAETYRTLITLMGSTARKTLKSLEEKEGAR
jgi:DNA-binding protein H-NS